jgi:hypothetical protein
MLVAEAMRRGMLVGECIPRSRVLAQGRTLGRDRPLVGDWARANKRTASDAGFLPRRFALVDRILGPSASRDRPIEGRGIARQP